MLCPKCGFEQAEGKSECFRCGIVFSKYYAAREVAAGANTQIGGPVRLKEEKSATDLWRRWLKRIMI